MGGVHGAGLGGQYAFEHGFISQAIFGPPNDPPGSLDLSPSSVDENLPAGTVVGQLTATDPDAGESFSFSLVSSTGSTDNGLFTIVGDELRLAASLDAEQAVTRSARVRVTDSGGLFLEGVFVITVNDDRAEDSDGDGLTEAEEEDIHGTSDLLADTDGDGVNDGVEVAFGFSPTQPGSLPALTLTPGSVLSGTAAGVPVGLLSFSSGVTDVTFALVGGTGDADNAAFTLEGGEVLAATTILSSGGAARSIRARATRNGFSIEAAFNMTVLEPGDTPFSLARHLNSPATGTAKGAQTGYRVAVDGDLVAATALTEESIPVSRGVVRIMNRTTGAVLHRLYAPPSSSLFGGGLAISGSIVVVGDSGMTNTGTGRGRVYVYDLSGATPTTPVHIFVNPVNNSTGNFGSAVGISGNRIVVGDYFDTSTGFRSGRAYVFDLSSGTPTTATHILENPTPASDDHFGRSVGISGTRVVVGAPGDDATASNAGRAYAYDLAGGAPTTPTHTLAHPTPASSDEFGMAVAVSGSRIVVGVPNDDPTATNAGAAFAFDVAGGTPLVPTATYLNPSPASSDQFGSAVAISGTRVVIGAMMDDPGGTSAGAAFVFDATSGTVIHTLNNPAPNDFDEFGISVAVAGDTVIVGAWLDDTISEDEGAVYRYDLASATPLSATQLNQARPSTESVLGMSLAMSGGKLAVGAPDDSSVVQYGGRVYVYEPVGASSGVPLHIIENPLGSSSIQFGRKIALHGSILVVGAQAESTGFTNVGRVFVYDLGSGTPAAPLLSIPNPEPALGDNFGSAVAVHGNRVVVGVSADDALASNSGSVYVFDITAGTAPVLTIRNPTPAASDAFGAAVAIEGTRLLVGAPNDAVGAAGSGVVHEFDLGGATPATPVWTIANPTPAASDAFGTTVALSGSHTLIGATGDDTGALNAGAAYVYELGADAPVLVQTLLNPNPVSNDNFGSALSISGSRIVAGVSGNDTGGASSGTSYFFDLLGATPAAPAVVIANPSPAQNDIFGFAVAVDGALAAISAPGDDSSGPGRGSVYLFDLPSAPEIVVESPGGAPWTDNDPVPLHLGTAAPGGGADFTFVIRNAGTAGLQIAGVTSIAAGGEASPDFTVATAPGASVAPGGSTSFILRFAPSLSGVKAATIRIYSNDADETPFDMTVTATGNTPPVFTGLTVSTLQGDPVAISEAKILLRATDADGQTPTITATAANSAEGATISRGGGVITYATPALFTGVDTFTVTLSDGISSIQGTITVNVAADPGLNPRNPPKITVLTGGAVGVDFFGIPGRIYGIQRSPDLSNWTQIAAPTAAANGEVRIEDPSPPQPSAFYRIVFPAQ